MNIPNESITNLVNYELEHINAVIKYAYKSILEDLEKELEKNKDSVITAGIVGPSHASYISIFYDEKNKININTMCLYAGYPSKDLNVVKDKKSKHIGVYVIDINSSHNKLSCFLSRPERYACRIEYSDTPEFKNDIENF